jgi:hypothetical protein
MPYVGIQQTQKKHMHSVMATHVYTSTLWLTSAACAHIHHLAHERSMCVTHPPSGSRVQHVYASTLLLTSVSCASSMAHLHLTCSAHFRTHVHARACMHLTHRRVAGFANRIKTSSAAAALAAAALGSSSSTNPRCTAVSNGGSVGGGGVGGAGAAASVDCDVVEMTTTAPTTTHPKRSVTQAC